MPDTKTYSGGCHCGQVRFEVTTDLSQVMECNCSICAKTGWLVTFVPPAQFKLLAGGEQLSDYQFAGKTIHHLFCPVCGVRSFARGSTPDSQEMYAVNVRCLPDAELSELKITPFDGKSL